MPFSLFLLFATACTGAPDDSAVVTCDWDGVVYQVGDSWEIDCGNTCTCLEDGAEECTDLGCA